MVILLQLKKFINTVKVIVNMEKIKVIVNNPLFKIGIALAVACVLVFEKMPLYAGIAVGIAIREFLLAFKK